jgi:hypothetical protein
MGKESYLGAKEESALVLRTRTTHFFACIHGLGVAKKRFMKQASASSPCCFNAAAPSSFVAVPERLHWPLARRRRRLQGQEGRIARQTAKRPLHNIFGIPTHDSEETCGHAPWV